MFIEVLFTTNLNKVKRIKLYESEPQPKQS